MAFRQMALQRFVFGIPAECSAERTICDAQNTQRLPGRTVREEGDPATGDPAADEAYDGLGATLQFYCEAFERDSLDGKGMSLRATVHFGRDYDNAFYDGRQMIFGDGDGEQFNRFTIAVDVIGHELTHGVTDHEAGLVYWGQSGALNESVSDVFGSLIKQYTLGQTADEADWLIGEGLFTSKVNGEALRSMKSPGTAYDDPVLGRDPQPDRYSRYDRTLEDNGGVHINSGIPNRAFYETAVAIGGPAWERAGRIWYETLTSPLLRRTAQFQSFANLTLQTARQIYGAGSTEYDAVRQGWDAVEVPVTLRAWAVG